MGPAELASPEGVGALIRSLAMGETHDPPTGPLVRPDSGSADTAAGGAGDEQRVSLAQAGALMSAGTALSRVTGFVRVGVIAWAIGATESKLADTYNLANSMPNMVYQLVIGEVLATIFVPVFVEHIKTRARDEAWRLASSLMNLSLLFAAIFSVAAVLLAPWLIRIFTFGVDPALRDQQNEVGAFFLRIFMPQMIFYAAGMVLTGLLNAHRRFGPPMFAPVLNNLIVIATFVVFQRLHPNGAQLADLSTNDKLLLAGGTTLGVIVMTLVLLPSVRRLPGALTLRALDMSHPAIKRVGTLAKYSLGYVTANQIALWAVYALANREEGGVTVYQWSWILYQLPYGIFAVSIITYIVREVSDHNVVADHASMRREVSRGLRMIAFIIIPASVGFIALAEPIIRLLLEHGRFGAASTSLTADTFALMATGLAAYAAFQQIMRAFYAMQDTRTPFYVNLAVNAVNVGAAVPLFGVLGVRGLALAHAASYVAGAIGGGIALRARLGGLDGRRLLRSHARIATASLATGGIAWIAARALGDAVALGTLAGQAGQVFGAVVAGLVTYGLAARVLHIEEARALFEVAGGRAGRRGR